MDTLSEWGRGKEGIPPRNERLRGLFIPDWLKAESGEEQEIAWKMELGLQAGEKERWNFFNYFKKKLIVNLIASKWTFRYETQDY